VSRSPKQIQLYPHLLTYSLTSPTRIDDLIAAIEETERRTRGNTQWFGEIDVHHVYFEGLVPAADAEGVWEIVWGS
jgi:hypothetical protein